MKKLKAVYLLLGVILFIPISGCSQVSDVLQSSGVSKNCDELAKKFLPARFQKAAENNGVYTKEVVMIDTITNMQINDLEKQLKASVYSIHPDGMVYVRKGLINVNRFTGPQPTIPDVNTSSQISCNYFGVYGKTYSFNNNTNKYDDYADEGLSGENVIVSENKDGIYWKDF